MSSLVACHGLGKSHSGRRLFQGLSLSVRSGERLGLVGPNGSGKSTLLRLLAGEDVPDEGTVAVAKGTRMAYLPQDDVFPAASTPRSVVLAALADRPLEPHERESRAVVALGKVGFLEDRSPDAATGARPAGGSEERAPAGRADPTETDPAPAFDQDVAALSGGWRKRLAIARELAREPDVLLLDEPTNHLDLDGILWLERLLRGAPFAFVIVSHDRYVLDEVVTAMVELHPQHPEGYIRTEGVYSDMVEKREAMLNAQLNEQQALSKRVASEVKWLKQTPREQRCKSMARFAAAEVMKERLGDLNQRNAAGKTVELGFSSSGRRGNAFITVDKVTHALGGRTLLRDLSFELGPGDRLGLLGPNGSGKTTLLRLIEGLLAPDRGTIKRAQNLRLVRFAQDRTLIDPEQTLRHALCENGESVTFRGKVLHVSSWSRRFLFDPERLDLPVRKLSGGEKARIHIARLMLVPADVLLLDEPTNDLDIPSLEVLEESLLEFPGALVIVSHDRFLLDRVSTGLVGLAVEGEARLFGDHAQYLRARAEAQRQAQAARSKPAGAAVAVAAPQRKKKLSNKEQAEWDGMEAAIHTAEEKVAALQRELESGGLSREGVMTISRDLSAAQTVVERLYTRWGELEARQT